MKSPMVAKMRGMASRPLEMEKVSRSMATMEEAERHPITHLRQTPPTLLRDSRKDVR